MAVVQRSPSSAEPTIAGSPVRATNVAIPSYLRGDSYQESQFVLGGRGRTPTSEGLYTGSVAYVKGGTPPSQEQLDSAVVKAATQRVERAGLPGDYIPAVGEYFKTTGNFPDLSALGRPGAAGAPGAPGAAGGVDGSMKWILIGAAALIVVVVLTQKGK